MKWFISAFKKAFNFSDRSRRTEYWMFALITFITTIVLSVIDIAFGAAAGMGVLSTLFYFLIIIPGLSLTVRRLHDIGKSGWWVLITLIPLVGAIVLLVFTVTDSEPASNEYGMNPKAAV
ncbi:MAG TPA: DUF805 domain-containing protein [Planococcus sp. (in: firmicutes)]|nr:DUF805 domain-containing protein [Planococcus sp. (in: firmicutes)]